MQQSFSIRAILKEANNLMRPKRWSMVKQYVLVAFVFQVVLYTLFGKGAIIASIIGMLFTLRWSLAYTSKGTFSYDDLFENISFKQFAYLVCSTLLVGVGIVLGFIALIIPGLILLVRWMFVGYLVVEKSTSPRTALRESARITRGNRWKLFLFMLTMIGINVIGVLCLVVGVFFTAPLTSIATAILYKKLSVSTAGVDATA